MSKQITLLSEAKVTVRALERLGFEMGANVIYRVAHLSSLVVTERAFESLFRPPCSFIDFERLCQILDHAFTFICVV